MSLIVGERQGVERGSVGGLVEWPVVAQNLIHGFAQTKGNLVFRVGRSEAEFFQSNECGSDVASFWRGELLLHSG